MSERVGLRGAVVVAAVVTLGMLTAGCTNPEEPASEGTTFPIGGGTDAAAGLQGAVSDPIQGDPVMMLAELHSELGSGPGGAIVAISSDRALDPSEPPTTARTDEVLWSSIDVRVGDEIELRWPDDLAVPADVVSTTVVVVDADGLVRAIGYFGPDGESLAPARASQLGQVVGVAAEALYVEGYDRAPHDVCDQRQSMSAADSPLDALRRYFDLFTVRPELDEWILWTQADIDATRIADESDAIDPVTGLVAPPNLNELLEQLRAGIPEDAIVVRSSTPVRVVVPIDGDPDALAVFIDLETGTFLGATNLAPTFDITDDDAREPVQPRVLDLRPPSEGNDVGVFIRSANGDQPWECPPAPTEEPLLVVPFEEIAGSGRATVDLATGNYGPFRETP